MTTADAGGALARARASIRERVRPGTAGARFVDKPFASVQLLLLAAGGLLGFGLLMAVSTTIAASHNTGGGSIWSQMIKEAEFVGLGVPLFWFAVRLPPRAYRLLAYPMLAIATVALVAVLIPGVGISAYGARRWIDVGPLQLQPSEFAKVALLLWGADLLARKQQFGTLRRARHLFVPLVPGFLLIILLVMLEPDLGTTCCFLLILLGLLWMVGMPMRYFATVVVLIAGAVTALAFAAPYRWERITTFLHPFKDAQNSGFHTVEGLYALASGGVFGVGIGQGTSKYGWVPNANSDYVFAIIGEELGLLGCLSVLALFGLLAYTGMRIARRNADPFVRIVAGAATVWLCGQAVINVGYVCGLLPVTGIPLPFISAGGTSLLASFFVLGMLTSFARHETPAVAAARRAERRGTRTRLERVLRIPVPRPYAAPKRRVAASPQRQSRSTPERASRTPASVPARRAAPSPVRSASPRVRGSAGSLRATGTDGVPRRVR
ncbi:MAG TPA: putative lipid II flippase FtsW [Jatrophihabitantaceae bacterium]|jgi:cell division protein FtsW|nr:putative lipid II flippase FtsW [Jatrophihabitantaceae bacterium]